MKFATIIYIVVVAPLFIIIVEMLLELANRYEALTINSAVPRIIVFILLELLILYRIKIK